MTSAEYNQLFQQRTKKFAVDVIRLTEKLIVTNASAIMSKQLIRSATSVAANYRASCIARSDRERYAKLCIVVEEADESLFWLEMLLEADLIVRQDAMKEFVEASELIKVFMAYRSKLKAHIGTT